ncbi:phage tail protein [Streptomyces phaeochromogenes]
MAGSGFLIASAHVDIQANTQNAIRGITNLVTKLVTVGPVAIAAGAATAAAVGGITSAFSAAGLAAGAFALAAKPQIKAMQDSSAAAEKLAQARETEARKKAVADKLSAQGSDLAGKAAKAYTTARLATKDAEEAYARATKDLPAHTREAALAQAELKTEYQAWSDSLAKETMPVFTQGINLLRQALPKLTPFVRIASFQFEQFLNQLGEGRAGAVFKQFAKGAQHHAGGSLNNFLLILKNIAVGFIGILNAFMPMSVSMSGGLADLTAKFAAWGAQLGGSSGFQKFMDYVKTNGPLIGQTLSSIAITVGKLVLALAPLAGMTLPILVTIAEFVSKLPPPVILGIAAAIIALKVALIGFRIAAMLTGTAMWPLITATWAWTAALLANPMTYVVLAIAALVVAIVLIATKTTWFQQLWDMAWSKITSIYSKYIKPAIDGIVAGFQWLYDKLVGHSIIPDLVNAIKGWWNKLLGWIASIGASIKNAVVNSWNAISSWVLQKVSSIASGIRTGWNNAKSFVSSAVSGMLSGIRSGFSSMVSAVKDKISSAVSSVKSFKSSVVSFFSGAASWLVDSGKKLIQGFINGIKNMAGSVKDAVGNVLSGARDLLPFSPAKEGPFSGRGWTEYSGASLMQGLATGIDNSARLPYRSMSSALGGVSGANSLQPVQPPAGNNTYNITVNVDGIVDLSNPNAARKFATAAAPALAVALKNQERERR